MPWPAPVSPASWPRGRRRLAGLHPDAVLLGDQAERVRRAADSVQPRAPRRRRRARLPLLSYVGREVCVRRNPADQDLHELPLADLWTTAPILEPVRASFRNDTPLTWIRVNDLPDFVYFNHQIHVRQGVGCATCHGPVDKMPLMYQAESLLMEWCLDCHRAPEKYLRPREEVFNMATSSPGRIGQCRCAWAPRRGSSRPSWSSDGS